jgi:ribose/xylose/arabinose/galactoside ABC-type transport system permease subunit
MARSRLVARDRTLLFGLGFGLVLGLLVGRKVYSPFVVVFVAMVLFACAYFALRLTRDAREGTAHHRYDEEEVVEA